MAEVLEFGPRVARTFEQEVTTGVSLCESSCGRMRTCHVCQVPQASWFRLYFTRRNRFFKTLALYAVGSKIYLKCDSKGKRFPSVHRPSTVVGDFVVRRGWCVSIGRVSIACILV